MAIDRITSGGLPEAAVPAAKPDSGEGFGDTLAGVADKLSQMESQANDLATNIASGDLSQLHDAMIAMQKASMALEVTVQVRNKVLDAYQEIMRMQV